MNTPQFDIDAIIDGLSGILSGIAARRDSNAADEMTIISHAISALSLLRDRQPVSP